MLKVLVQRVLKLKGLFEDLLGPLGLAFVTVYPAFDIFGFNYEDAEA
ncbi:hypothetical protein GCM10010982_09610 [Bowmanella pacifica]|uniref:Uncharacterized protein n=1 Tax=Bowmanella pacifica TaxID=502051 RepID=A0A917YT02_9ALTE|nr:hypothetical protein GCM10010982_09610 [Bowmanella pacifica]